MENAFGAKPSSFQKFHKTERWVFTETLDMTLSVENQYVNVRGKSLNFLESCFLKLVSPPCALNKFPQEWFLQSQKSFN